MRKSLLLPILPISLTISLIPAFGNFMPAQSQIDTETTIYRWRFYEERIVPIPKTDAPPPRAKVLHSL